MLFRATGAGRDGAPRCWKVNVGKQGEMGGFATSVLRRYRVGITSVRLAVRDSGTARCGVTVNQCKDFVGLAGAYM